MEDSEKSSFVTDVELLKKVRGAALGFLSRREHSRVELAQKLIRKNFEPAVVNAVLSQLQAENLLSDHRFMESFVYSRINRGYGPLYIRQALKQRGVSNELLMELLENETDWNTLACQVRQKRFGESLPENLQDRVKQSRFLQYRGFTPLQIQRAFKKESGIGN